MESDGERGDSNVGNYAHSMACSLSNLSLDSSGLGEIWWRERVEIKKVSVGGYATFRPQRHSDRPATFPIRHALTAQASAPFENLARAPSQSSNFCD